MNETDPISQALLLGANSEGNDPVHSLLRSQEYAATPDTEELLRGFHNVSPEQQAQYADTLTPLGDHEMHPVARVAMSNELQAMTPQQRAEHLTTFAQLSPETQDALATHGHTYSSRPAISPVGASPGQAQPELIPNAPLPPSPQGEALGTPQQAPQMDAYQRFWKEKYPSQDPKEQYPGESKEEHTLRQRYQSDLNNLFTLPDKDFSSAFKKVNTQYSSELDALWKRLRPDPPKEEQPYTPRDMTPEQQKMLYDKLGVKPYTDLDPKTGNWAPQLPTL